MANCSDFTLKLSGHPFKLKQARDGFIATYYEFSLREIYNEEVTHTPPTWELHGEGRWGVDINSLVSYLEPYGLSGTITDSESGSNFFCKVELKDGVIVNSIKEDYVSDAHYEHCPDNNFWYEQLYYAIEDPKAYSEDIEFLIKHNILTDEDLEKCTQMNK